MNHLETNGRETKIMTMELDVYQHSDDANYDMWDILKFNFNNIKCKSYNNV